MCFRIAGSSERKAVLGLWFSTVREFSKRLLTFESDRLDAVSALAERLSRILQDEYIGGVWKGHLLLCLQWTHGWDCDYVVSTRHRACGVPTGLR